MNINLAKIEGGLTTLMNNHLRAASKGNIASKIFAEQLEDLLEMVIDMQGTEGENQPITVTLTSTQVEILRKRIEELEEHKMQAFKYQQQLICRIEELKKRKNELEETCEANNEVIDKQFQKIQRLQRENKLFGGDK